MARISYWRLSVTSLPSNPQYCCTDWSQRTRSTAWVWDRLKLVPSVKVASYSTNGFMAIFLYA